jgi:hypothetical protein
MPDGNAPAAGAAGDTDRLAMRGVPLAVIAAQLGHADTRMVEKHYGHLSPRYVADTVRAAFGTLGLVEPSNVVAIATSIGA